MRMVLTVALIAFSALAAQAAPAPNTDRDIVRLGACQAGYAALMGREAPETRALAKLLRTELAGRSDAVAVMARNAADQTRREMGAISDDSDRVSRMVILDERCADFVRQAQPASATTAQAS
jgi:hypothetical protein